MVRAVVCKGFGPPEALVVEDVPRSALKPGEVRIKVAAAGLNFADTLIIRGEYQMRPNTPFTPGFEVAGTVIETAGDVTSVKTGTRVVAVLGVGGFAEELVAPHQVVFAIPDEMPWDIAAAFPVAYGTAHAALHVRAGLKSGDRLLVLGAAGGVGLASVEIGKAMGATVIAAARGAAKLELARAHGADHVTDYETDNLRVALRKAVGGGIDVILDPVGGPIAELAFRQLDWNGRHIVVGFAGGLPQFPANIMLVKNIAVLGLYWTTYWHHAPESVRETFAALIHWWRVGRLRPVISATYPFARVADAMAALTGRTATGKIVLVP